MDTAELPISEADNSELELIEKLLEYSENESQEIVEDRDRVVFTSSWEEAACGWKKTAPNVRYISSADRKTKAKEKCCQGTSDSESHYTKVKRLAGMIANSHSSAAGENELRNTVRGGTWAGNRALRTNMRNFKNADVLSYDTPCWRYIIDPRTLQYVDRTPLQVLRNLSTSHKYPNQTLILENGGIITFQETYDGGIALNDPALSFDRRLLGGLHLDEDKGLYGGKVTPKFPSSLERSMSLLTQYETDDHEVRVIRTLPPKKEMNSIFPSELCKLRPHDLTKTDSYRGDCSLEVRNHNNSELKPLQKITATQRQTAEESILAQTNSGKKCGRSKENKAFNQKRKTGTGGEGKLDWLPITRNTIGYPYPSTTSVDTSHNRSPERLPTGFPKPFSLQRHIKKGKKLTLSEAANLVPSQGNVGHALEKLSQELDKRMDKGLPVSKTLLPSVSGTKLEVPTLVNLRNV